jgi:hypothetical protein
MTKTRIAVLFVCAAAVAQGAVAVDRGSAREHGATRDPNFVSQLRNWARIDYIPTRWLGSNPPNRCW